MHPNASDVGLADLDLTGVDRRPDPQVEPAQRLLKAKAQRSARVGASKVASSPSPVDFRKSPCHRLTSALATSSCRSSSWRQARSPSAAACAVELTISVKSTVARIRSVSCAASSSSRAPVRSSRTQAVAAGCRRTFGTTSATNLSNVRSSADATWKCCTLWSTSSSTSRITSSADGPSTGKTWPG